MSVVARIVAVAVASALATSERAPAHHSVAANFDSDRQIEITGEVVEWRFRNPHSFLVVNGIATLDGVETEEGIERWEIESGAAAGMRALAFDADTFKPGDRVTIRGAPHRNPSLHRANAFAGGGAFLDEDGTPIGRAPEPRAPAVAASGVGVERLEALWRPPFQPVRETSPLALNARGLAARRGYDQKLSPANTCEPMSIPDIFNAPSYVVTIEIEPGSRAIVRNQAYNVVRTAPLDGSSAPADPEGLFGTIRGRIEDGALVLESRDYPPSAWGLGAATQIMGSGADAPSSAEKIVTERFSVSEDGLTLIYEYTVHDPVYLDAPFSHRVEMARLPDDTPVYLYDCDVESASLFSRD